MIPDIGNFMVLLLFSNFEISDELWKCLIDESSIRQMYWMFHGEENVQEVMNIIKESKDISHSRLYQTNEGQIQEFVYLTKSGEIKIESELAFKEYLNKNGALYSITSMVLKDKNIFKFKEFKETSKKEELKSNNNPFDDLFVSQTDDANEETFENNFEKKINDYLKVLKDKTLYNIFEYLLKISSLRELARFYPEQKLKDLDKSEYERGWADAILKDIKDEEIRKKLLVQFFNN